MNALVSKSRVAKVEQLDNFNDEYVYDIGIDNDTPYFFGNNILVHNSSYFSIETMAKNNPEIAAIMNDRDSIIQIYDSIADDTNDTFPEFMMKTFNTSLERGSVIKAGRELIGSRGLFITKKRYAILMYDKEGERLDVGDKPGKIKAMGLDLKRSDTPKVMQEFLERILLDVLTGGDQHSVIKSIKEFRTTFKNLEPWFKGSPKRVNSLTDYFNRANKTTDINLSSIKSRHAKKDSNMVPGHVQASLNWNKLRAVNNDRYSMAIQDGQKIIVCKLKQNHLKMDSIAYPIDEMNLPDWFKKLPFDDKTMEETIIDQKISNLIGILNWDLRNSKEDTTFNDLFEF